ncbi:MAG: hypothetical protein WEB30_01810 [Cyclobacteriaceae bacterium]
MDRDEFLKQIHRRVAQTSVGPSAIRNQGASGLITISRNYFAKNISLTEFRKKLITDSYKDYLDKLTADLRSGFPNGGKSWGAARKGLNLFFRDVVYNKYLADLLNLPTDYKDDLKTLRNLEVPLDRDVASGLNKTFDDLPRRTTIKDLNEKQSKLFQDKALIYADRRGIARIHLDLEFWRSER